MAMFELLLSVFSNRNVNIHLSGSQAMGKKTFKMGFFGMRQHTFGLFGQLTCENVWT
jgi:hypothetical protein